MLTKTNLKIDWATHAAAKFACENWHYSKILPTGKVVKIGAWENEKFIGVVLFSRGASPFLGAKFDLPQTEVCELTRVALNKHETPVSRIVAIAFKFLKKHCPDLKLVVSFADPEQGHSGGIYKAGNWVYTGTSGETIEYLVGGRWRHVRGAYDLVKGNKDQFKTRTRKGKYRFLMPLDEEMRKQINKISIPYPKRATSKDNVASGFQSEEGGVTPTVALQSKIRQDRKKTG